MTRRTAAVAGSPVLGVPEGSMSRRWTSSFATGRCSTPLGTTNSSPGPRWTSRSRSSIVRCPLRTRKRSSVSSCLCQTNSPWAFTTITSCPLNWATVRGCQCSENVASFASRLTWLIRSISSRSEHGADPAIGHSLSRERKRAVLPHVPGGAQKSAEGGTGKRAANADALHSDLGKVAEAQLHSLQPHHDIHRSIDGTDHRGDVIPAREARRVEHIRSGLLIGLKPLDGVLEIPAPYEIVLCPRGQHERKRKGACHLYRGTDPLDRQLMVVDRIIRPAGAIFDRA